MSNHTPTSLLREVRAYIHDPKVLADIGTVLANAEANEDVVEGVGVHEVGSIVNFKANFGNENAPGCRAKVMRNRGTRNGKVLYDLALEVIDGRTNSFYEAYPLREVDSTFVLPLATVTAEPVELEVAG